MVSENRSKIAAAAVAGLSAIAMPISAHAALVINEVYGGGGSSSNTAASYSQDFIELYNNGTVGIDLTGYAVEYASAAGAFPSTATSSNVATLPSFTLSPGQFFLVSGAGSTSFLGATLPTPDATSGIAASASAGKLGLFDNLATQIDLVSYGSTATPFEGTVGAAPGLSVSTSDSRTVTGLDTNNNALDFTAGTPSPMNSHSTSAPEPATIGLAAAGALLLVRRRK